MANESNLTNKDILDVIDKCNSDEDLLKLEFCKKDSNEIEKIIANIFIDVGKIYRSNKKMCLDLNQIIKLLKIRESKNIKAFDRDTFDEYEYVLENIIVQNDKAQILFSDFMLIIRSFSCKDYYAYFMSKKVASFITQNIKWQFLNAVEENGNNIVSTDNKILCDDNSAKLAPDEMMMIRSKTSSYARSDLDKWIWGQFVDSDWSLEQVFNFFKLNGDLYPIKPVTDLRLDNNELLDINYTFISGLHFSEELANAIQKKMDLYVEKILLDEKTDCLTLEEIKVIAISNFNFNQNQNLKEKFLNRIPEQIDLCYFRYFVSIFVRKELAEQNLIDQEFINSYMDRVKINSEYEKDALNEIKKAKEYLEYWTPKATNLRIKKNWEDFKSAKIRLWDAIKLSALEDDLTYKLKPGTINLSVIEDDLTYKLKPGTLDPDLADTIIREMPKFKNNSNQNFLRKISNLIKTKRANKNLIYSNAKINEYNTSNKINNTTQHERVQSNTNSTARRLEMYVIKDNTGRPWYVILGHIFTLGIFLWGPLLFDCMFGCCCGEPEEEKPNIKSVPNVNSDKYNNKSKTVSTMNTALSSGEPGMAVVSNQQTK